MNTRILVAAVTAAALAVPATAVAQPGKGRGAEKPAKVGKKTQNVTFVFKGTFTAPGTIEVLAGNAHARKGGFVGEAITVDLASAKLVVADTNGDGTVDVADVKDGDRVLVQARMLKRTKYMPPVEDEAPEAEATGDQAAESEGAIVARKLIARADAPGEDAEPAPVE